MKLSWENKRQTCTCSIKHSLWHFVHLKKPMDYPENLIGGVPLRGFQTTTNRFSSFSLLGLKSWNSVFLFPPCRPPSFLSSPSLFPCVFFVVWWFSFCPLFPSLPPLSRSKTTWTWSRRSGVRATRGRSMSWRWDESAKRWSCADTRGFQENNYLQHLWHHFLHVAWALWSSSSSSSSKVLLFLKHSILKNGRRVLVCQNKTIFIRHFKLCWGKNPLISTEMFLKSIVNILSQKCSWDLSHRLSLTKINSI